MKTELRFGLLGCALSLGSIGCGVGAPASSEELSVAAQALAAPRAGQALASGRPWSGMGTPLALARQHRLGALASETTIQPAPDVSCQLGDEQVDAAGQHRSGRCNGGDLKVELLFAPNGERFHATVHLSGLYQQAQVDVAQTWDFDSRADFVDGVFSEESQAVLDGSTAQRSTRLALQAVDLDANGCAVSGEVIAARRETDDGDSEVRSYDLLLGPSCGEIRSAR